VMEREGVKDESAELITRSRVCFFDVSREVNMLNYRLKEDRSERN